MTSSTRHQRRISILLALTAASFSACQSSENAEDRTPTFLPQSEIAGFEEVHRALHFSGAIPAEVWIEVVGADEVAARARRERWPLLEAPEHTLQETASFWRDAMQRALFRSGVALAERPHAECWKIELRLQQLVPTDAWLNAIGAEVLLAESGRVDATFSVQDPRGTVWFWCRLLKQVREPSSRSDTHRWDEAAREALRSASDRFAAELRPQ